MAFYSRKQKQLAKNTSAWDLKSVYRETEKDLEYYAQKGDMKKLKETMKKHKDYEYASLYKESMQYRKKVLKDIKKHGIEEL